MKFKKEENQVSQWSEVEVKLGPNDSNQIEHITEVKHPEITYSSSESLSNNKLGRTQSLSLKEQTQIYHLSLQGMSDAEISRIEETSHRTVTRTLDRLANNFDVQSFKKGYTKLLQTGGVLAVRKLVQKLDSAEADKANIGTLAVVAGILTDKQLAIEASNPSPPQIIDWTDMLTIDAASGE